MRMAAITLERSQSYLGARFRSFKSRLGPGKATKAMAAYLARQIYRMLTKGEEWVDRGAEEFEKRHKQRKRAILERMASDLGCRLVSTV